MSTIQLRKANPIDADLIWKILQQAIERRRIDGSNQWQDGYPNPETIQSDIEKGIGYILTVDDTVAAYSAVILNDEPAYKELEGQWLSEGDFYVVHRVAVHEDFIGQGLAKKIFLEIEKLALKNNVFNIKVDTNFDNGAMLNILEKMGYQYCGEVHFRGSARKAFEKLLK